VKLGINLGYAGASFENVRPVVERADRLGLDSVWVAEAYGSDAVSVLGYLAAITERIHLGSAILQIPARTPSNVAMTAMTLDALSGGRFRLGLGMSGPQVVEGWHGVAYGKPLGRTREYVEVVRRAIAREQPLTYDGRHYQLPYQGADATGLGKPLKSILHPLRPRVPIYLAAIGPRNVEQTGEIADGWLPIFYSPERESAACEALDRGLAKAGRSADDVEIVASAPLVVGDDLDTCRDQVRPALALYIGGMGARGRNFYFDLACRYGFEDAARRIQDNYLEGRKAEAVQAVPDELIDQTALVGPLPRVIDRLAAWKESRVTTLTVQTGDPDLLERLAEAL